MKIRDENFNEKIKGSFVESIKPEKIIENQYSKKHMFLLMKGL